MSISFKAIGRNIKTIRKQAGLTQEKAASLLNMSTLHYGRLERGERVISLAQLELICDLWNISFDVILSGSTNHLYTCHMEDKTYPVESIGSLCAGCSHQARSLMIETCQLIARHDKFST